MKRIFCIVLAACTVTIFSACGDSTVLNEHTPDSQPLDAVFDTLSDTRFTETDGTSTDSTPQEVSADVAQTDFGAPPDSKQQDAVPQDVSVDVNNGDSNHAELSLTELMPESLFNSIFLHRATAPCQGAFYTYQAFIDASKAFPTFAQTGPTESRKRELAAFFANISHETTGGWATAPDGPYSWGLCWLREGATIDPSQLTSYCQASTQWPCKPGQKYYGRGPIQLSWNYNYGPAGVAIGEDLLANPDRVIQNATVAFKTALWFWQTPQAPKPSCHDVITGAWVPTSADITAGRQPGFGMTINIINGGIECNKPTPAQVTDRVGYYNRYTSLFGVTPGLNLTCESMKSY